MANVELKEIKVWTAQELISKSDNYNISIKTLIEEKTSADDNSSLAISDWLKWCESQINRVKVIDFNIPQGVLPEKCNGCIHDIKVQGKRRAPDDALYNKYADLRYTLIEYCY